jgi:hypothetical protein
LNMAAIVCVIELIVYEMWKSMPNISVVAAIPSVTKEYP